MYPAVCISSSASSSLFFGTGIDQLSFPGADEALLSGYLLDVAQRESQVARLNFHGD
jgi:hypothetical protein